MKQAKSPSGKPLTVIILTLLTSAAIRLGAGDLAGASEKILSEPPAPRVEKVAKKVEKCQQPPDVVALMRVLNERKARLDQREKRLQDRLQALNIAQKKLDENRKALVAAEKRLEETLTIADKAAEQDLAKLTAVYEDMKPKNAARLFESMAPEFAAGFLGRMDPQRAAAIMSSIQPQRAYEISLILAGRNAGAPEN